MQKYCQQLEWCYFITTIQSESQLASLSMHFFLCELKISCNIMNKSEFNLCHLIMHGGGGGMLTALFIIGRGLGLILKAVSLFIR